MLCGWLMVQGASLHAAPQTTLLEATYIEPTTRYAHGVLGDAVEWGALRLRVDHCPGCAKRDLRDVTLRLPQHRVFEDVAPRLVDLDGTGATAVLVVESDARQGARLALYTATGLMTSTPFIGRANRWLAPVGWGDLDGDGVLEFAYVDRPHLAKTLRVWRLVDGALVELAAARGYSNHRIGWDYIEGGIRNCGQGPEMILASGDWRRVMAVRFDGALHARELGAYSAARILSALACR